MRRCRLNVLCPPFCEYQEHGRSLTSADDALRGDRGSSMAGQHPVKPIAGRATIMADGSRSSHLDVGFTWMPTGWTMTAR